MSGSPLVYQVLYAKTKETDKFGQDFGFPVRVICVACSGVKPLLITNRLAEAAVKFPNDMFLNAVRCFHRPILDE